MDSNAITQLAPGSELGGRYRILELLGKGGMGCVYKAVHIVLGGPPLAIKQTFYPEEDRRHWFENEAKTLKKLDHRSLPKVSDYFADDDRGCFFVMDFVEGLSLAEIIAHTGPLHPTMLLPWTKEILEVLHYLHTQVPPVLHRDIKPVNIKIHDGKNVFLLDFGLAKSGHKTLVPGISRHYSSLEQERGLTTDARSDLYSLGATLYYLLAGSPPADAYERNTDIENKEPDPLIPLRQINSNVSEELAMVVHKALELQREDRFLTADEMLEALILAEISAYERGKRDAERNIQEGKLILKVLPTNGELISSYKKILQGTYNISVETVEARSQYLEGYDEIFDSAVKQLYGDDFEKKLEQQLRDGIKAEEKLLVEQAKHEQKEIWRFFKLQNRANKSVTFQVLNEDSSWQELTLEPLGVGAFWRKNIKALVKFRPSESIQEKQYTVESKVTIEGAGLVEEAALINYFSENEAGEIDLYCEL